MRIGMVKTRRCIIEGKDTLANVERHYWCKRELIKCGGEVLELIQGMTGDTTEADLSIVLPPFNLTEMDPETSIVKLWENSETATWGKRAGISRTIKEVWYLAPKLQTRVYLIFFDWSISSLHLLTFFWNQHNYRWDEMIKLLRLYGHSIKPNTVKLNKTEFILFLLI